jgi:hypothetical protein
MFVHGREAVSVRRDALNRGNRARAGLAILASAGLLVAVAIAPAGAAASSKTTLQISAYGYFGKVKSPNGSCVADRTVVLKQKGHGVLGRDKSDEQGRWKVDPEDLHFKGQLPFKIYAEVKASGSCGAATSKTITIKGG